MRSALVAVAMLGCGCGCGCGGGGASAPAGTPATPTGPSPAPAVEILVVPADSHLGQIRALLPDGRGLVQVGDGSVVVVDPRSGAELEPHRAPRPDGDCRLDRWGPRPALRCDLDALYRLDGDAPGAWTLVTRAVTDGQDVVVLSDDGVHAAYDSARCPGEPAPPKPYERWALCLFGPGGWRRTTEVSTYAPAIGMHGARLAVDTLDGETWRFLLIDADTLEVTADAPPSLDGAAPIWRGAVAPGDQPADGTLFLRTTPRDAGETGPGAAGVLAVRAPDGTWSTRIATDAPRERWGVRVGFVDALRGVAAGSFYRHVYYTVDGGRTWTAIAGLDPDRDAHFDDGRMIEDSNLSVRCDATRACRVGLRPEALVVRFAPAAAISGTGR